ncbi:Ribosomal S3Ae family protein [Theileria parva strain Muguga]|uniref:Small ribosomal subunit protein eS1 n=1 Tax=Theileria parva TaxID=5875 RepID=RS3A_THEPA|nr:Ribosomal S3Ae family protein [Theileria parva strain Muguga]Q4MYZ4.1 RecName: Full=Small ribosomal subunit protein eS1; AltName: Full=40S ribosomal protein S3a [Theileria parva]EAN30538.1 Ribosomal S3Ae family protein [Theileria parva strain Muguga]|eukprot:XP_762821.1 40S ribosomal protein S3A [Theileria parva strain Muguga]
MAVGKNKRVSKGKKGAKKKVIDPFSRKEWYNLKAPVTFNVRNFGQTLVTKTVGTKLATDGLKGRVFEMSLADLNADEDQAYRKIKLSCEDVQGRNCLTDFHGTSVTRDKLCSLIRKNYSLIEAFADVKTLDGYNLRLFCVGYTKRRPGQLKSTCYVRTSKVRLIHKKMVSVMTNEASNSTLKELVKKVIPESIGKEIEKACKSIFPLQNVLVRKIKVLKKPKFDLTKLMESHNYSGDEEGRTLKVKESENATNLLTAELQSS